MASVVKQPLEHAADLSLSTAQERLWFLHELEPDNPVFHVYTAFRLVGILRVESLERRFNQIIEQQAPLQTAFKSVDGHPIQQVEPTAALRISVENVSDEILAAKRAAEIICQPFNLEKAPLLRVNLLRISEQLHLLVVVSHQIVIDEDSLAVMMQQLSEGSGAANEPYYEAIQAQAELTSHLDYWKKKLAGAPFVSEMATDMPRPAVQAFKGSTQSFVLSANLTKALQSLSDKEGTTLSTTLLTVFQTLLFRYTGQEDMLVGVQGRSGAALRGVIGPFADMLLLRSEVTEKPSFREFLRRVHRERVEAEKHSAVSFAKLLETLNPERDLSRQPLAQVTFRFDEHPVQAMTLDGVQGEPFAVHSGAGLFDLSLILWPSREGLAGRFEYNPELFHAATIERAVGHLQTLLEGLVKDADQAITHLPLLTAQEREQILGTWNNTQKAHAKDLFVYRLFELQAEQRPDAIAAIDPQEQVTYAELNRRANRLARFLVEQGIGPDMLVALLADRSVDYLTAMLAVHKAGGAFLPMDPRHPAHRLAQVLDQSETTLVLTAESYVDVLSLAQTIMTGKTPKLALIKDVIAEKRDDSNLPERCEMHHLAYVMFTSGSTGTPKGVMVEHVGMVNHNYAKIQDTEMDEHAILAQNGPQSFDIMVWQFVAPLIVGAKVHIFPDEVAYNPIALLDELERAGITVLQIVPALLTALAQEAQARGDQRPKLAKLKWVVPTGEALPTELCRVWLKLYPNIPLLNTYGSTECSDDQCHIAIRDVPPADYPMPIMTIGTPIPNMKLYILDAYLQPVPVGIIGELYVGGIGVGRGYLKDEARTNKAFIADPFTAGMRLYKTADRGRFYPDGSVEFLGRVDHMVKLRGYRIELGEIESVLAQHPAIKKVVVIVREDSPGNKRLVAYLVADNAPSTNDLRDYLRAKLPEYMVPSAFMFLDDIPLTGNQKVDRKALPAPEKTAAEIDENYIAPRNKAEQAVAEIWQEVLGLKRVGVYDNFFELGGHSLIAVRIFAQIEKRFGKKLPLAALFRAPTVEALASLLDVTEKEAVNLFSPVVEIQTKGSKPPFWCVGGGVINLRNLSKYLGDDQPFYALQSESLDGYQAIYANIDEIAAFFIKAIRSKQAKGPYYIAGAYGSGMVALEIGRQLEAAGEHVAFMGLFNTRPSREKVHTIRDRVAARTKGSLSEVIYNLRTIDLTHLKEAGQRVLWKYSVKAFKRIGRPLPRILRSGLYEELLVRRAGQNYKPQNGFKGVTTLIYTHDWYEPYIEMPKWGWDVQFNGELITTEVPGVPCDMFLEPHVSQLAKKFKTSLEEAQAAAKQKA
ncbi:MAG: amino acid adenylation domain-containing protein [Anaerolineae bacterium]